LIPLRAFKADGDSVSDQKVKVSAVVNSGFNIERIASFDSEGDSIRVEFDWLVYLRYRERCEEDRKDRDQN
jgi:hypothetical protein